MKVLIISNLGHAPHRIPPWAEELAQLGFEVDLYSPNMRRSQIKFHSIPKVRSWRWIRESGYRTDYAHLTSHYNLYSGKDLFLPKILSQLSRKLKSKPLQSIYQSERSSHSFRFDPQLDYIDNYSQIIESGLASDQDLDWWEPATKTLDDLCSSDQYDWVISSSSPQMCHLLARYVVDRYNIKWIADYRDLWSLNHTDKNPVNEQKLLFERSLLQRAELCLTATQGMKDKQKKVTEGRIEVIHNAFDEIADTKLYKPSTPPVMTYTGSVYLEHQDLYGFLEQLDRINSKKVQLVGQFVGASCGDVKRYYQHLQSKLPSYIKLKGYKPRSKVKQIQAQSDYLLLLDWLTADTVVESTKLFEYLASGRPIYLFGNRKLTPIKGILNNYPQSEIIFTCGSDVETLRLYGPLDGKALEQSPYSVARQAETMAKILSEKL
jgi:glycosyltransferase involved in cell wall biosynthesis